VLVRRVALSAVLVVAMVAVLLPAASAVGAGTATKVIVSLKFPAYHGSLQSAKNACESGRTVRLYREKAGADKLLGTDTTSPKGKWSIPIGKRLTSGAYYAKAIAKGTCKAGKSKVLTID
jgi:hypothetical protein